MSDVAKALAQSSLASAEEARRALRVGWTLSTPRDVDAQELLRTYQIRLERLSSMPGSHAAQLAESIAELLPNLETAKVVKMTLLSGPAEHEFAIFLSESAFQVLGCLKVVSKLDVSSERWEELWQGTV